MSTMALILAAAPAATPEFDSAGELVRVILSLVGIIAMIVVAGWLTRRMQRRPGAGGRRIRCVESFAVGTRDRLLLLDVDGKRMLIGMGAGGMRALHVYEGAAPADDDRPPFASPAKPAFADMLARFRPRT